MTHSPENIAAAANALSRWLKSQDLTPAEQVHVLCAQLAAQIASSTRDKWEVKRRLQTIRSTICLWIPVAWKSHDVRVNK